MRDPKRVALWLVGATLAYNVVEAAVAIWAGELADSIALIGFGLDSVIESAAAVVMLRHLVLESRGASPEDLEMSEHRTHRFIGITFLLLSAYVAFEAGQTLWFRETPAASLVGIVLAALSATIMPAVSYWKLRIAKELGSAALRSEAKETLACAWLSVALLAGLGANAWAGWWWTDPLVALLMVPWLVKEGLEGLRGDPCPCDEERSSTTKSVARRGGKECPPGELKGGDRGWYRRNWRTVLGVWGLLLGLLGLAAALGLSFMWLTRPKPHVHVHTNLQVVEPSGDYPVTTCVVSGKPLPSPSRRTAVMYEGIEVQFCCDVCIPKFEKDPGKYMVLVRAGHK